jgi:hypothetical protein
VGKLCPHACSEFTSDTILHWQMQADIWTSSFSGLLRRLPLVPLVNSLTSSSHGLQACDIKFKTLNLKDSLRYQDQDFEFEGFPAISRSRLLVLRFN